jgi:glucan biosynthesis protein C
MSLFLKQATPENVERDTTPIQPLPQATNQMHVFFLHHLRVALAILVVLVHLAQIYDGKPFYYYVEPLGPNDQWASLLLYVFILISQAYFIGCFFLIIGHFTPGTFDQKGPLTYSKDRLLCLGIPVVVYVLLLNPIACIGLYHTPASFALLTLPSTWQQFPSLFGVGPLWYAEMLLFFCLGYVIWRRLRRARIQPSEHVFGPPSYRAVGLFIVMLALASYLLRIVVPVIGTPIFGFPSLAYLPQYLSFFILGAIAFRRNWFQTISSSMGIVGFVAAGLATIVLFPLAFSSGMAFIGHGTWQSAVYALWDSTFSVGMCLGLVTFFRRFLNRQNHFSRFLSQHAFTVYVIHLPIIILLALAIRGIHLEALLKFALAALIGVPLCFVLAFLVRKIPFSSKIL